ncbi:delta-12 fatty acid desaturase [Cladochytrium replicatum]|nr:delta-12 fatty acid desaturase [Cladochytrium replicatum]
MAPTANRANNLTDPQRRKPAAESAQDSKKPVEILENPPSYVGAWSPPEFTVKELWDAIPSHCFKRDMLRSFSFVAWDVSWAVILFYAATHIDGTAKLNAWLPYALWPLYWVVQGAVCTGIWVLAHECGHRGFSDYAWVDNTVGFVLHTSLLVPFFSWKYTHAKHHKANAHMDKDQVFVPSTRSDYKLPPLKKGDENDHDLKHVIQDSPIYLLLGILRMVLIGWPAYLLINSSGQRYGTWTSHFRPSSQIFEKRHYWFVVLSEIGVIAMLGFLTYLGNVYGIVNLAKYYIVPYLVVNFWLVTITYLQHTDIRMPHYRDAAFNFVRGSLSTVDRDYGILNTVFHHIADTHVAHHLFSQMPHYHAEEATRALKKVLGDYYVYDDTNVFVSLYRSYQNCRFVEDKGDIVWYKH